MGLRKWALLHLGAAGIDSYLKLAITAPPNRYCTEGPYRWMRHPAYAGSLILIAGCGMLALGWGGFVIFLGAWPHFTRRVVLEENQRALHEETRR
jgi:protein-S-isoprenylcysteine O-methyltransferase Ste14